ncbi:hypothetical protein THTE_3221 [Thermogutta terrifontis]|uniref:Uncharacterized protein n=1 Tax=Thermogutta terrifontis TaxID=1331910 RepID=A0A286RIP2_9BACT|nr:hypothetical protein THTE_3221 [Thermogutta terrifontis]
MYAQLYVAPPDSRHAGSTGRGQQALTHPHFVPPMGTRTSTRVRVGAGFNPAGPYGRDNS